MYARRDYLKKAFYHLMKMEQKLNKILEVEDASTKNLELAKKYIAGEKFESRVVFVKDGEIFVSDFFFDLPPREQDVLIDYYSQFCKADNQ